MRKTHLTLTEQLAVLMALRAAMQARRSYDAALQAVDANLRYLRRNAWFKRKYHGQLAALSDTASSHSGDSLAALAYCGLFSENVALVLTHADPSVDSLTEAIEYLKLCCRQ